MRVLRVVPLCALLCAQLVGCGAGEPPRPEYPPFTAEHEPLFENGVDMVSDPEALGEGGAWLETWEQELAQRVGEADVVAVVTVQTFRTDIDLERRETYRLIAHPDQVYLGELDDDIALTVHEDEGGYGTVGGNERRFLDRQFIAFIKYQTQEDDSVRPRWHLSMATDAVASRVRRLLASRIQSDDGDGSGRRRIVVHRN